MGAAAGAFRKRLAGTDWSRRCDLRGARTDHPGPAARLPDAILPPSFRMDQELLVRIGFIVLPITVALAIAAASRRRAVAVGVILWVAAVSAIAASGLLRNFDRLPPPVGLLFVAGFAATIWLGCSTLARPWIALPFAWVVGFQSFRIVVEVLIHASSEVGLAPPQMTWSGLNLDIVTGVTALFLAPFADRVPRLVLWLWNFLGLALLAWVVGVAVVSFPTRLQLLTPSNTWVAEFPYVWLPTVLVTAALLGHVVLFRKLRQTAS